MQEFADKTGEVQLAAVTFASREAARQYVQHNGIHSPMLIDEERKLYREYGMLQSSFRQVWGLKTWWVYAGEILRGRLPEKRGGDIRQQGGDVLIDPAGIVRLHHVGEGPADRPGLQRIAAIIKGQELDGSVQG